MQVLHLLGIYWKRHPDLRLGQLLMNLNGNADIFYVEDDILTERLKIAIKEGGQT